MEIKHITGETKGYFQALAEGVEAGRITYSRLGNKRIILDHTEVQDAFRGQNVGKQLVMAAVAHARENGLTIIPLCPYAKSVFERTEEIRDVLGA